MFGGCFCFYKYPKVILDSIRSGFLGSFIGLKEFGSKV